MKDLVIREAILADAHAIATIQVVASFTAYAGIFPPGSAMMTVADRIPVWERFIISGKERILVGEERGQVRAYVSFGPCRDDDQPATTGELYSLYVVPERWRGGLGRKLLHACTVALVDACFDVATLWVLAPNDRARGFYERFGWRLDGAEKPVDAHVVEVRYRKDIASLS